MKFPYIVKTSVLRIIIQRDEFTLQKIKFKRYQMNFIFYNNIRP